MADNDTGKAGTIDQKPRWEGPPENRPRGYLPAKDDPVREKDAAGESLSDPDRSTIPDKARTREGLKVENDARGQFARARHGGDNDGTVSAYPRAISGDDSGDATFSTGNERETGARKPVERAEGNSERASDDTHDRGDRPRDPYGLTEPADTEPQGDLVDPPDLERKR